MVAKPPSSRPTVPAPRAGSHHILAAFSYMGGSSPLAGDLLPHPRGLLQPGHLLAATKRFAPVNQPTTPMRVLSSISVPAPDRPCRQPAQRGCNSHPGRAPTLTQHSRKAPGNSKPPPSPPTLVHARARLPSPPPKPLQKNHSVLLPPRHQPHVRAEPKKRANGGPWQARQCHRMETVAIGVPHTRRTNRTRRSSRRGPTNASSRRSAAVTFTADDDREQSDHTQLASDIVDRTQLTGPGEEEGR